MNKCYAYHIYDRQAKLFLGPDGRMVKTPGEALRLSHSKCYKIREAFGKRTTRETKGYLEGLLTVVNAESLEAKPTEPTTRILHFEEVEGENGVMFPLVITYEDNQGFPCIGLILGDVSRSMRVSCEQVPHDAPAPEVERCGMRYSLTLGGRMVEWGTIGAEGMFVLRMFNEGRKGSAILHMELDDSDPVKLPNTARMHIRTKEAPWMSAVGPWFSVEGARASRGAMRLKNPTATLMRAEPVAGVVIEDEIP